MLRVCDDLCAQLQADAEGVTKRVVVTVTGATSEADALTAARTVARDSLVKTALFGSDANWGRVLAAVGMAPVTLDPNRISVSFNGSPVCVDGVGAPGAREVDLSGADIDVTIDLGVGDAAGVDPHHRPVPRLRRRELGVQLMTADGGPPASRPMCSPRRCRGSKRCTTRSSSSSTAATR